MTWRVEQFGTLPFLVVHVESSRSIGWFVEPAEADVVCCALNRHEENVVARGRLPAAEHFTQVEPVKRRP